MDYNYSYNLLIQRLLEDAEFTKQQSKQNPNDIFYQGQEMATISMLITMKNAVISSDLEPKDYGLDFEPEKIFLD